MNHPGSGSIGATGRLIADGLRDEILRGELKPGTRIGQEALAERFSTSRIPVRESLRMLEAEGLVSIVPNSGAWVAKIDARDFDQIYRLREHVESFVIRESVVNLSDDQITRLRELAEQIASAASVELFLTLDREFHLLTYAGAGLPHLHEMVQRFWNSTQHYRRAWVQIRPPDKTWATDAEHVLIVNAIERRDAGSASTLVRGHIRRTRLSLEGRPDLFA